MIQRRTPTCLCPIRPSEVRDHSERRWSPPHAFDAFRAALYYSKLILIVQFDHHLQITLDVKKPVAPPQTELTRWSCGAHRFISVRASANNEPNSDSFDNPDIQPWSVSSYGLRRC